MKNLPKESNVQDNSQPQTNYLVPNLLKLFLIALIVLGPGPSEIYSFFVNWRRNGSKDTSDPGYFIGQEFVYFTEHLNDGTILSQSIGDCDPDTFTIIKHGGENYGKTKSNIYYKHIKLEGVEAAKFHFLSVKNKPDIASHYATDNNLVYYDGLKIDTNTESFIATGEHSAEDNNFYYLFGKPTLKPDKTTAKTIGGKLAIDKFGVIFGTKRLKKVDLKSVRYIGGDYWCDKDNVYYRDKVVKCATSLTIRHIAGQFARDDDYVYCQAICIENADPDTFVVDDAIRGFAHDINTKYIWEKPVSSGK